MKFIWLRNRELLKAIIEEEKRRIVELASVTCCEKYLLCQRSFLLHVISFCCCVLLKSSCRFPSKPSGPEYPEKMDLHLKRYCYCNLEVFRSCYSHLVFCAWKKGVTVIYWEAVDCWRKTRCARLTLGFSNGFPLLHALLTENS